MILGTSRSLTDTADQFWRLRQMAAPVASLVRRGVDKTERLFAAGRRAPQAGGETAPAAAPTLTVGSAAGDAAMSPPKAPRTLRIAAKTDRRRLLAPPAPMFSGWRGKRAA